MYTVAQPKVTVVVADVLYPPTAVLARFILEDLNKAGYETTVMKKTSRQPIALVPVARLKEHLQHVADSAVDNSRRYPNSDFCITVQRVSIEIDRNKFVDAPMWLQELEMFLALVYNPKTKHEWIAYDFLYGVKGSESVINMVKGNVHDAFSERSGYMEAPDIEETPTILMLMELFQKSLQRAVHILPPSPTTLM